MAMIIEKMNQLSTKLINEIMSYIPEYGYSVNQELHDLSVDTRFSYYCDPSKFMYLYGYRWLGISYTEFAWLTVTKYSEDLGFVSDLKDFEPIKAAKRYLKKNENKVAREFRRFLDH